MRHDGPMSFYNATASFYNATAVQAVLGISKQTRQRLTAARLLNPEGGTREARYPAAQVEALRDAADAPDTDAIVVRLGPPTLVDATDETPARWIGWNEEWPEERQQEAARRYWNLAHPEGDIGKPLIAAMADWAVAAWRITDARRNPWGATEYTLSEDPEVQGAWRLKNLHLGPGIVGAIRWPRHA